MAQKAGHPAKNEPGEFATFTRLLDRLLSVPHEKIKAELDREKRMRPKKRAPSGHAFLWIRLPLFECKQKHAKRQFNVKVGWPTQARFWLEWGFPLRVLVYSY